MKDMHTWNARQAVPGEISAENRSRAIGREALNQIRRVEISWPAMAKVSPDASLHATVHVFHNSFCRWCLMINAFVA